MKMRTKAMQKEEVLSVKLSSVKKEVEYMEFDDFKMRLNVLEGSQLDLPIDINVDVYSSDWRLKFSSRVHIPILSYIIDYKQDARLDDELTIYIDHTTFTFHRGEMISIYWIEMFDSKPKRHVLHL